MFSFAFQPKILTSQILIFHARNFNLSSSIKPLYHNLVKNTIFFTIFEIILLCLRLLKDSPEIIEKY
jgi:hypothetical protein